MRITVKRRTRKVRGGVGGGLVADASSESSGTTIKSSDGSIAPLDGMFESSKLQNNSTPGINRKWETYEQIISKGKQGDSGMPS